MRFPEIGGQKRFSFESKHGDKFLRQVMDECPDCGLPLTRPTEEDPLVCQRCIMAALLGDEDSFTGMSNSDDYEIEREIGRGGDGTVYLGYDKKVGRQVALKLIRALRGDDGSGVVRFRTEVEAIASLDHPNIIPIYSNGELDGRLFYSMKFVSGGSLEERMAEFASPEKIVTLMSKLALAVHHAHERGILHRDLKPSNILLDENGEPFISDFGLAKRSEQSLKLTVTGAIIGTPAFMSPEQARGDGSQVTTTSDVFSLGSIFYQLLTGEQTFEGETAHIVLRNVIESQVCFPQQTAYRLDRDLETVCLKCLEKSPEKRYQSALALAEDLDRWRAGEAVEARRISSIERAVRWMRRYPFLVGMIILAAGSLVTGSVVSLIHWHDAEKAREVAEMAEKKAKDSRFESAENEYFLVVSEALAARKRYEFGLARRLLGSVARESRGVEWYFVKGLLKGDQDWSVRLGEAAPLHLTVDRAKSRVVLLDAGRTLREVDPESGELSILGKLPPTPGGSEIRIRHPGILHFQYSPDGRHYSFLDGRKLVVANAETHAKVAFFEGFEGGEAGWLNNSEVIRVVDSLYMDKGKGGELNVTGAVLNVESGESRELSRKGWKAPIVVSANQKWITLGRYDSKVWHSLGLYHVAKGVAGLDGKAVMYSSFGSGDLGEACFSPNGRFVVYSTKGDHPRFRLVEIEGRLRMYFEQSWPTRVGFCFSSDSRHLFVYGREPWFASINFLDPQPRGKERDEMSLPPEGLNERSRLGDSITYFAGHEAPVISMAAVPNEDGILTVGADHLLSKWSLQKDEDAIRRIPRIKTTLGYDHPVNSHNGRFFLYRDLGNGQRSTVWHRPSETRIVLPAGQSGLAVFNDGRVLSRDRKTKELVCWGLDLSSAKFSERWREGPFGVSNVRGSKFIHSEMTPDERMVTILFAGFLMRVDMDAPTDRGSLTKDQIMVWGSLPGQGCAVSPDGRFGAVSGFLGPQARLYDLRNFDEEAIDVIPGKPYTSKDSAVAFSPDGSRLFVGNNDGWVRVFEVGSWRELSEERWRAHSSEVTALALAGDGETIVTAGGGQMILWDGTFNPGSGRRQRLTVNVGSKALTWLSFCDSDRILAFAKVDGPLETFDISKSGAR